MHKLVYKSTEQKNYVPSTPTKKTGPPPNFTTMLVECFVGIILYVGAFWVVHEAIW